MARAASTFGDMSLYADQLDARQCVINKGEMFILKLATIHEAGLEVRVPVPVRRALVPPNSITLLHIGRNNLREGISRPVQPRFDRPQIAVGDLGDFLVRLALELTQDENMSVMLGQFCD